MARRKRNQDSPVNDQDPIDQDTVDTPPVDQDDPNEPILNDGRDDDPEPALDNGRTIECVVMHPTGIQLDSLDGYFPYRARVIPSRYEYDNICAMDDAAGRDHRLLAI
jgi:hypothetical protein